MAITLTAVDILNNYADTTTPAANDMAAIDLTKIVGVRAISGSRTIWFVYLSDTSSPIRVYKDVDAIEAYLGITLSTDYKNWVKAQVA